MYKLCPWYFLLILPVTVFLGSCITIERLEQPTQAQINTVFTTTVTARPNLYPGNGQPYLGVQLPINWTVVSPVNYTGSYTGNLVYNSTLAAQLESTSPKAGYYWWAGKGNNHEILSSGQPATATLHLKTNDRAGFYDLNYSVGDSNSKPSINLDNSYPITVTAPYAVAWDSIPSLQYQSTTTTSLAISTTLVNLGEAGFDTFDLSITAPAGWQADFHDNTVITNTGAMSFLQRRPLNLKFRLPSEVSLGSTAITLSAKSTSDENAVATKVIDLNLLSDQRGYALTNNNGIREIDPVINQVVTQLSMPFEYAESLAIHPDGQYIYTTFPDNVLIFPGYHILQIFNVTNGDFDVRLVTEGAKLGIVKFTCDGSQALVSDRSTNRLFLLKTTRPSFPFQTGTIINLPGIVNDIAIGSCGSNLAVTTYKDSNTIAIIDTKLMTVVKTIPGLNAPGDIVVTANGQRAYVANADGKIGVIDLINQSLIENVDIGNTVASQLAISPNGKNLYIGAADRLSIWGETTVSTYFQENFINDIEISPDGETIYVTHSPTMDERSGSSLSIVKADSLQLVDVIKIDEKLRNLILFSPTCNCRKIYLPLVLKR